MGAALCERYAHVGIIAYEYIHANIKPSSELSTKLYKLVGCVIN